MPEVAAPEFDEVVVPAEAVIGLQVENSVSSETARLEDQVSARVTRDVRVAGRVAIPAGSRVQGSVVMVVRGGKFKERARLGIRFHRLITADGGVVIRGPDGVARSLHSGSLEEADAQDALPG